MNCPWCHTILVQDINYQHHYLCPKGISAILLGIDKSHSYACCINDSLDILWQVLFIRGVSHPLYTDEEIARFSKLKAFL